MFTVWFVTLFWSSHAVAQTSESSNDPACSPVPGALRLSQLDQNSAKLIAAGNYSELRAYLKKKIKQSKINGDGSALDPELIRRCCQHELLMATNDAQLILNKDKANLFMMELLANPEWIQDLLCSGPVNAPKALSNLYTIWRYERRSINTPLYRKLSAACAIIGSSDYSIIHAFRNYRNAHRDELLQWDFDKLESWELRHVIAQIPQQDWDYIINERNNISKSYFGACWAVSYRLKNDFGDSIHGSAFYPPWNWTTQKLEGRALAGGVCGSCSTYGSFSTKVHGYPSYTAGEPGHCAYVIRTKRDDWRTAYSVTGHTRPYGCFWRPFVYSDLHLMEAAFAPKEALRTGYHYAWLTRVPSSNSSIKNFYQASLKANPLNLGIWINYGDWLTETKKKDISAWKQFSKAAMTSFSRFPDVIAYLNSKYTFKHIKKATPTPDQVNMICYVQDYIFNLKNTRSRQNFAADLTSYENFLNKDKEQIFNLYSRLLKISVEHKANKEFLTVFQNMRKRFATDKVFTSRFDKVLSRYVSSNSGQTSELKNIIVTCIEEDLKNRDFAGYKSNIILTKKILDISATKERGIGKWINKCPKNKPFPGKVISKGIILWPTNTGKSNRVISYPSILDGSHGGGTCQTGSSNNPTINFTLPEKCKISGIVVTSGYESKKWIDAMNPVILSVSNDEKTWKEIYKSTEAAPSHRIDLKGKSIEVKYIRLQSPSANKKLKKQMVLRQFIVYGTTNY